MRFFFLDIESDGDVFDDESNDDGSGSGFTIESSLSSLCPFFEISTDNVLDCHVMESQNPFVVSVEYSQSEYFLAQKVL